MNAARGTALSVFRHQLEWDFAAGAVGEHKPFDAAVDRELDRAADRPSVEIEHDQGRSAVRLEGDAAGDRTQGVFQESTRFCSRVAALGHALGVVFLPTPLDRVAGGGKDVLPQRIDRHVVERPVQHGGHCLRLFEREQEIFVLVVQGVDVLVSVHARHRVVVATIQRAA